LFGCLGWGLSICSHLGERFLKGGASGLWEMSSLAGFAVATLVASVDLLALVCSRFAGLAFGETTVVF